MTEKKIDAVTGLPRKGGRRSFDTWDTFTAMAKAGVSLPLLFTPQLVNLGAEFARIVSGQSSIQPGKEDRRFDDPTWFSNPIYKASMQTYLAWRQHLYLLLDESELGKQDKTQARAAIKLLTEAISPSHSAAGIDAIRRVIKARGASLVHGLNRMTSDMLALGSPATAPGDKPLKPGKEIAASKGAVVFRNELLELIQYQPAATQVFSTPILLIPSPINKFYIYDLYRHNSLTHYLQEAGLQVFCVSWRNPEEQHRNWNLESYLYALIEAAETVSDITAHPQLHLFGYSGGGIFAALLADQLSHHQKLQAHTAGFALCNFYTHTETQMGIAVNPQIIQAAKTLLQLRSIIDGVELARMFAWLRPNNLLWNAWICNYFGGEDQPTADVRHWNNDVPRVANGLFADFLELYVDNYLLQPGQVELCGHPVDLSQITCDKYIVAGSHDHISPWECAYQSSLALGRNREFVLVNRGHMRSLVCPEGTKSARYYTNTFVDNNYDDWLAEATEHDGSWWPHWIAWLRQRSEGTKKAPRSLGNKNFPAQSTAPGNYVLG